MLSINKLIHKYMTKITSIIISIIFCCSIGALTTSCEKNNSDSDLYVGDIWIYASASEDDDWNALMLSDGNFYLGYIATEEDEDYYDYRDVKAGDLLFVGPIASYKVHYASDYSGEITLSETASKITLSMEIPFSELTESSVYFPLEEMMTDKYKYFNFFIRKDFSKYKNSSIVIMSVQEFEEY